MAKTQQAAAPQAKTPAAVKAAATRAAKAAEKAAAQNHGPTGKVLEQPPKQPEVTDEQRQGERRQAQNNAMAQFAQSQMSTPAVHTPELDAEAAKLAAFNEAVKKLAAESGINPDTVGVPTKAAKATKADKLQKNGITRPASGTTTGAIWDVADEISLKHNGHPATIAEVKAHAKLLQANMHTIKTQYARWRGYHGIKGRVQLVQAEKPSVEGRDEGIEAAFNRRKDDPAQPAQ